MTIVRLFNTVGPRQTGRYGMVIPSLVKQAIMGQPLTVFGDGEQSRCFGHVRDVVGALVALIETPDSTGEIFNVGSDREITINSLAELVREMTESSAPIVHMSYDEAYADGFEDMRRREDEPVRREHPRRLRHVHDVRRGRERGRDERDAVPA